MNSACGPAGTCTAGVAVLAGGFSFCCEHAASSRTEANSAFETRMVIFAEGGFHPCLTDRSKVEARKPDKSAQDFAGRAFGTCQCQRMTTSACAAAHPVRAAA